LQIANDDVARLIDDCLTLFGRSAALGFSNKAALAGISVDATKLTPNDRILFSFGDCIMKGQTKLKTYSSAYRYLDTKLRSLGHRVVFYPERFTSQRFPMTGTQMQ
jgi:hypothetical protein